MHRAPPRRAHTERQRRRAARRRSSSSYRAAGAGRDRAAAGQGPDRAGSGRYRTGPYRDQPEWVSSMIRWLPGIAVGWLWFKERTVIYKDQLRSAGGSDGIDDTGSLGPAVRRSSLCLGTVRYGRHCRVTGSPSGEPSRQGRRAAATLSRPSTINTSPTGGRRTGAPARRLQQRGTQRQTVNR